MLKLCDCMMKNRIFTISKCLPKIHIRYEEKNSNFTLEKPDKYHLYHVLKVSNIINTGVYYLIINSGTNLNHVPRDMMY